MPICCSSSIAEVETPLIVNARPEPFVAAQKKNFRLAYSSPMNPSQYTRTPEDYGRSKEASCEAAAHLERSLEQVLLGRRWFFHCASPLFRFHCDQLNEYAHDLVKTLRAAALRASGHHFGYSVSIRNTDKIVAFEIREERDRRRNTEENTASAQRESVERFGGFVLYLPTDDVPLHGQERRQVILFSGDAELLHWARSWLQLRFQCVVGLHAVRILQQNLKRLARNWSVLSLIAEGKTHSSVEREKNYQEVQANSCSNSVMPPRAPLLLKYRATKEADVLRTYSMTVPWATLRRLFQQSQDGPGGNLQSTYVPELIELVERLYLDSLPFDLATYEIERVELQQVVIYVDGGVELYSMDFVHTVLSALLELLAVQSDATMSRPETTF